MLRSIRNAARQLVVTLLILVMVAGGAFAQSRKIVGPRVEYPLDFSISKPVRDMPPQAHVRSEPREMPRHGVPHKGSGSLVDPVVQSSATGAAAATTLSNWEGLGQGYPNFAIIGVPPRYEHGCRTEPHCAVGEWRLRGIR